MKRRSLTVLIALICLVTLLCVTVSAAPVENGFSEDGNCYYINGEMVTNAIVEHEGQLYAFDYYGMLIRDGMDWIGADRIWARPDGTLYTNCVVESNWGSDYYFGPDGLGLNDFQQWEGETYYFSGGILIEDGCVYSGKEGAWFILGNGGKSYQKMHAGWTQFDGEWYYAEEVDGSLQPAQNDIYMLYQKAYGKEVPIAFDGWGIMCDNGLAYISGGSVYAQADGVVWQNKWYQDSDGSWYYFGADGYGLNGFHTIGGVTYLFETGRMTADELVYNYYGENTGYFAVSADGKSQVKIEESAGWKSAFGNWYYMIPRDGYVELAYETVLEIDGKQYYFDGDYRLVTNNYVYSYEDGKYYVADSEGVLKNSGWYQNDGQWRYIMDNQEIEDGVYCIDGKYYLFENCYLVTEGGFYDHWGETYFVTDKTGVLYRNTWYNRTITRESEIGWIYFGDDGKMLCDTVQKIGNTYYGFDSWGVMLENQIYGDDSGAYRFGADGKGTKLADGWYKQTGGNEDMYVHEGVLAQGFMKVGGKLYSFQQGYMEKETWTYGEYNGVEGDYLIGSDGQVITKPGWVKMYYWFYIQENGTMHRGWLKSGGKWYYMNPDMATHTLIPAPEENKVYYADGNGVCTALASSGMQDIGVGACYTQGGKLLRETWKKVSGYWYYFDEDGFALSGGVHEVNGNLYLFDTYGKMQSGGWVYYSYNWYYADPGNDSVLYTGMKTIGGKKYIFGEWGQMYEGDIFEYEGVEYLLGTDGTVHHTFDHIGWYQEGAQWYYCDENGIVRNDIKQIGNAWYGFDYDGKMYADGMFYCRYANYYFDTDGKIKTGWFKKNGYWYYGDPEDLYLLTGHNNIKGSIYVFDYNGKLNIGTFIYGDTIYTTNSDGKVISEQPASDGWHLADHSWIYIRNGEMVDGWMGDYYFRYHEMAYDDIVEYNGKLYYLKPDGKLLRGGWYYRQYEEAWVLARADGSLYCSQWYQSGSTWYYFQEYNMAEDGIYWIGEEIHEFDKNGKWLGEVTEENDGIALGQSDGWHKKNGKWYYFMGGIPYHGEHIIGGKQYYFSYSGVMAENELAGDYNDYRYYGADGAATTYVGWKYLGGNWYYFNPNHTVYFGMAKDSAGWCYVELSYNENTNKLYSKLVTNEYRVIGGSLYYFNAAGSSKKAISHNGWYKAGEEWYYFENGTLIGDGYREIGGAGYYFVEGLMVTEYVVYNDGRTMFFDASGKRVTKAGWYQRNDSWVYVMDDGNLCDYGFYKINGKEYTFVDYMWIQ